MGELKLKVERLGLESVPKSMRTTSALEYTMLQIAISVNAGNFLVPALAVLEGGLSFGFAVLSTVMGAACAFLFVSFLSIPGARYGIPAQYAIRTIMGIGGAKYVASPIRTLTSLYWFSVQTIGGTYFIKEMLSRIFSDHVPFVFLAVILALLMAVLALIGFGVVKKITTYCLPILFIGGVVMLWIMAAGDKGIINGTSYFANSSNQLSTMLFFASLAFVQYISGVSASSDMARYGKSSRHAFYGLFVGNVLGFALTAVIGAATAVLAGSWNPYVVASQMTDSPFLILIISLTAIISMININMANAYTGGYSLLNTIPQLGRVKSAIVFGLAAICLSAFPALVEEAKLYISYLGALVIPISAIIVTDFLFIKKRQFSEIDLANLADGTYAYNILGLVCAGGGTCLYIVLPDGVSPGFVTFLFVSLLYFLLNRKRRSEFIIS